MREQVKILGQTVSVGSKAHEKLVAQKKHFDDLQKHEVSMPEKILKQNSTHKAVKNGDQINIILKGFKIADIERKDELLYSIPASHSDDLFSIFENIDEENRINKAEFLKGL